MTRPRQSPAKSAGNTETSQNKGANSNAVDASGDEASTASLRADLESIQITDREEDVDGGIFTADTPDDDNEEAEGAAGGGASGASSSAIAGAVNAEDETKTRQRHSSIQRVEHLHRFPELSRHFGIAREDLDSRSRHPC